MEEHPIDDPDDHEPGGEHRRGTQRTGSEAPWAGSRRGRLAVQREQQRDAVAGLELKRRRTLGRVVPLGARGLTHSDQYANAAGIDSHVSKYSEPSSAATAMVLGGQAVDAAHDLIAVLIRALGGDARGGEGIAPR